MPHAGLAPHEADRTPSVRPLVGPVALGLGWAARKAWPVKALRIGSPVGKRTAPDGPIFYNAGLTASGRKVDFRLRWEWRP
jgi:hypothetical protein